MELEQKTILITGASSGIGAAAATLFAREGARLVLGARRAKELQEVAARIIASGGEACVLAGDVIDPGYARALVDLALDRFGTLDGAFNNAGTLGEIGPVTTMETANWCAVLDTNLTSAFHAARAQIPPMERQGSGAIVFTGSFVGYSNGGMPGMAAYAASKAGMVGLTQALASEHAVKGVRINVLLPGGTRTAMAGEDADTQDFIAALHPIKRMARPEEIAQAALFLLSERASFVTGTPLLVDGGISVRLV